MLIALGIIIQLIIKALNVEILNMKPVLPVIGTLGLVMIVLEASLDLKLEKRKRGLIIKSISSAFILFAVFTMVTTLILVHWFGFNIRDSFLNSIPLGIINSAVAISAASLLKPDEKEFIIYESSFSDIFGIIIFDLILISHGTVGEGIMNFILNTFLTVIISIIITSVLAILLHKVNYHINYVIIMTVVVLVYVLAKLAHLPALLLVLMFGLILANNRFLENTPVNKYVDFNKFRSDLGSFKKILSELTFLVRSFFFIMFGYYTKIEGLFNFRNLITAFCVIAFIFLLRYIFIRFVLRLPVLPLLNFAPRGLITILLFLSIPFASRIELLNEEVITLVILLTIIILMIGNIGYRKEKVRIEESAKNEEVTTITDQTVNNLTGQSPN